MSGQSLRPLRSSIQLPARSHDDSEKLVPMHQIVHRHHSTLASTQARWRGYLARQSSGPAAAAVRQRLAAAADRASARPERQVGALTLAAVAAIVRHADLPRGAASASQVGARATLHPEKRR